MNLAVLGREYLLAGHLIDRAGMPQVIGKLGREGMEAVAIEEWRGASPVYTRRVQRALGFGGDDVATIFKGMQLDIGAPHRFMDFRYAVDDAMHGRFWLASCGALMDVEPMGEEFVVGMCHHIEDPTFDATAAATNPRARMRPVHRPPRTPVDRHPHCEWTVAIDPDNEPVPEPDEAVAVARSLAAKASLGPAVPPSYAGAFDPAFELEHLALVALERALDEICLQGHLLVHSFLLSVAARTDGEVARRVGAQQLAGVGGVVATRLARLGLSVGEVFDLHPAFLPRAYVGASVESDAAGVTIRIDDAPALHENQGWSWPLVMDDHALAAIAYGADRRAEVQRTGPREWRVTVGSDPQPEPTEVTLTRFSTGADFVLER